VGLLVLRNADGDRRSNRAVEYECRGVRSCRTKSKRSLKPIPRSRDWQVLRVHSPTKCWSWKTCPLAHHQFKEPRENRPERETEHQRFSGMQKIAELTYMALMVHQDVRKVGDRGEPKHPPQNTKDDPPCRSRQAVSPPLQFIGNLFPQCSENYEEFIGAKEASSLGSLKGPLRVSEHFIFGWPQHFLDSRSIFWIWPQAILPHV
jgi:hypothetical protein